MSPRRATVTGPDKRQGEIVNLRIQYDGDAVLTSKNAADNPRMDRFNINGELDGWDLDSPPEEVGYVPYARGPGFPRFTAQADALPFATPFWDQRDPLINGDPPEDPAHRAHVAPFQLPPQVELVSNGMIGYKPGWRGVTYAYGVGKAKGKAKGLLTNCAPLAAVELGNGQGMTITLPDSVTEGVTFLAIGLTDAYPTKEQALNATVVWEQRKERVRTRPRIPTTIKLKGPFEKKEKLSFTKNETFLGGPGKLGKIKVKKKKKPGKSKKDEVDPGDEMQTEVSYSINTEHGRTDRQGKATITINGENVELEPGDMPEDGKSYNIHFTSNTGNVQTMTREKKPGQKTSLPSNDPSEVGEPTTTEPDPNAEDDSGIEGPTSALDDPVPYGHTIPIPGKYFFALAKNTIDPDDGREEVTALGPVASADVPAGKFARIYPPRDYRNWIRNPEASERKTDTDELPEDWDRFVGVNVVPDDEPGRQKTRDTSGLTTNVDVAKTRVFDVSTKPTATHHAKITMADRVSGRLDYVCRQTLANGSTVETTLLSLSANTTKREVTHRFAANAGNKVNTVWNASVATVQFIVRHVGASIAGGRNFTSIIDDPLFVVGKKRPRKRKRGHHKDHLKKTRLRVSPGFEDPPEPYPTFGYTVLVLDPPDADKPLWTGGTATYLPGNFVEYYGPNGTPLTSTYFMGGLKLPVKAGETWTDSLFFYWEGADQPNQQPLKAVIKNSNHVVIQDLGGFIAGGVGGTKEFSEDEADADAHGWVRRKITYTVPEGAAYVEFVPGGVGDGLFRIGWPQHELGTSMTAWTDDHAPNGSITTFYDLGAVGVPRDALKGHSLVKQLLRIGAEVTHEIGITSHIVEAASKSYDGLVWSDWVTDIADLVINDMVRVRTTLFTSDIDYTPEFHSHFLDFERDSGLPGNGVLCRVDGTEFDGGCVLYNFPPPSKEEPRVDDVYADGTRGFGVMGKATRWVRGFGVECQLNSTAEEIMEIAGSDFYVSDPDDASCFVAEYYGHRYLLRILDIEMAAENREAHKPIPGMENDGAWNIRAEGLEAEVLDQEAM